MGRPLLVAVVGVPFEWKRIRYEAPDGRIYESRSSLKPIACSLAGKSRGVRVLVIAPDTVAAANRAVKRDNYCEEVSEAKCLPDPSSLKGFLEEEQYREAFVKGVSSCLKSWFSREVSCGDHNIDVDVDVVSGVGMFLYAAGCSGGSLERRRVSWTLSDEIARKGGNPMSHAGSQMLASILQAMIGEWGFEACMQSSQELELHVDLTHGINYLGVALKKAAIDAAMIYSAATGAVVNVKFYNSDPYTPAGGVLRVWRLHEEKVTPSSAALFLSLAVVNSVKRVNDHQYELEPTVSCSKRVATCFSKNTRQLRSLLGGDCCDTNSALPALRQVAVMSVVGSLVGAPLLLAQAGYEALNYRLRGMINCYLKLPRKVCMRVQASTGDDSTRIRIVSSVKYDVYRSLLAALAMALYAERAYLEVRRSGGFNVHVINRTVYMGLEELKLVSERYVLGTAKTVVEHELNQLKGYKRSDIRRRNRLAGKIYRAVEERLTQVSKPKSCCSVERRVFAAHAGLVSDLIEVRPLGCGFSLGYGCSTHSLYRIAWGLVENAREWLH